jgi:hypothetical protein
MLLVLGWSGEGSLYKGVCGRAGLSELKGGKESKISQSRQEQAAKRREET